MNTINPDIWDSHVPPLHPMAFERLKGFDRALMSLDDYPGYERGELELTYYFVIDAGYNKALSQPVATKDEAKADLERMQLEDPTARIAVNTLLI